MGLDSTPVWHWKALQLALALVPSFIQLFWREIREDVSHMK